MKRQKGITVMEEPIEIFLSYAPGDEQLRDELLKHLAPLEQDHLIHPWHNGQISAGTDFQREIDLRLDTSPLILLLISPEFFASQVCYSLEMKQAVERHEASEARVIPVILRPVDWQHAPFSKLKPLPLDGTAVTTWSDRDSAWLAVAKGIREVVTEHRSQARKFEDFIVRQPMTPESAEAIAKGVITFLEDQRMLVAPYHMEDVTFCVASADRTRRYLSAELYPLALPDNLKNHLREMRSAYRKFMQEVVIVPGENGPSTLVLIEALKELRATILPQIAMLAAHYHITDIDKNLAQRIAEVGGKSSGPQGIAIQAARPLKADLLSVRKVPLTNASVNTRHVFSSKACPGTPGWRQSSTRCFYACFALLREESAASALNAYTVYRIPAHAPAAHQGEKLALASPDGDDDPDSAGHPRLSQKGLISESRFNLAYIR
jgi:hypothetical protein